MKKVFLLLAVIIIAIGSVEIFSDSHDIMCEFELAPGTDLSTSTFWIGDQQVTAEQFLSSLKTEALKGSTGTTPYDPNRGKSGSTTNSTVAQPASQPSVQEQSQVTANNKKASVPKEKITVWFTNLYGNVIGSSQITKGTTVDTSQFPQTVEDCDSHAFSEWLYDGRVIEHETVIRAGYK